MTDQTMQMRLASVLGCELSVVQQLPAEKIPELLEAFGNAQKKQRGDMEKAIQSALGHLPALLRGPVIKILRG